jgi:hypothetical protein
MQVKFLFTRYPHAKYGSYVTLKNMDSNFLGFLGFVIATGAVVGVFAVLGVLNFAESFFESTFALWFWWIPSIIMTPFIVWRIGTRLCQMRGGGDMSYGNFVLLDVYISPHQFTPLHVAMYLFLAYFPFVNLVCVIAGIVSIARCDITVKCLSPSA